MTRSAVADVLLDGVDGGEDGVEHRAELEVELVEALQVLVDDVDLGLHAHGHADGVGAGDAAAQDDHLGGMDAGHAAQEDAGAALHLLQIVGADLHAHPAGDLAHRREERQPAVAVGDGLVGDGDAARLHQRLGLVAVGGEVEVGEQDLVVAQRPAFLRLRLLHLHDHLGGGEDLLRRGHDARPGGE